jgi:integrase
MSVFKPRRRGPDGKVHESPNYSCKFRLDSWSNHKVFALRTTDKRIAEMKERELRIELEKEAMGMLPPRSVRETLRKPLNGLLDAFLEDLKAKGRTPGTLRKYGGTLRILFRRLGWQELRDVSPHAFVQWRAKVNLGAKTLNDLRANLATFFRWLKANALAQHNPLELVGRIDTRGATQCRRALSPDEAARLLGAAPAFRAFVYMFALYTGLRRKELNGLRWADVLSDIFLVGGSLPPAGAGEGAWGRMGSCVRVPASISKNRKEAFLPLRPELLAALRSFKPADAADFQFIFRHRVPRIETLRKDLERAGIPLLDRDGRRVDFHSLRMTFGTTLLANGVSPRVAMELMRHSDIKLTTKLYTDPSQLPLSAGVAALPSFTLRNSTTGNQLAPHEPVATLPAIRVHVGQRVCNE